MFDAGEASLDAIVIGSGMGRMTSPGYLSPCSVALIDDRMTSES
jgi:hypothetical protein